MATNKSRLAKLEKQKAASGEGKIKIFIRNEDGGAFTSNAAGNETKYTAAEYADLQKQWRAHGDKVIRVTPESIDKGGDA